MQWPRQYRSKARDPKSMWEQWASFCIPIEDEEPWWITKAIPITIEQARAMFPLAYGEIDKIKGIIVDGEMLHLKIQNEFRGHAADIVIFDETVADDADE